MQCPECGGKMVKKAGRFGAFYGCAEWPVTGCPGTHGAHQSSGKPLGIPADAPTKRARQAAHEKFDALWKEGKMSRRAAYRWMRQAMGLTRDEAHIALFDTAQCGALINLLAQHYDA